MDSNKIKIVGTREEVYKGTASRTAGNLQKNDIIEKKIGNRTLYISKKISEKMKANISIFRTNNPNFLKSIQKQTMISKSQVGNQGGNQGGNQVKSQEVNKEIHKKKNKIIKTQKLSFKEKDNSVKSIYYPELQGMNLNDIRRELREEEAEEDFGTVIEKKNINTSFLIEDFPEITNNELE